jgi:hypothetical protein
MKVVLVSWLMWIYLRKVRDITDGDRATVATEASTKVRAWIEKGSAEAITSTDR